MRGCVCYGVVRHQVGAREFCVAMDTEIASVVVKLIEDARDDVSASKLANHLLISCVIAAKILNN